MVTCRMTVTEDNIVVMPLEGSVKESLRNLETALANAPQFQCLNNRTVTIDKSQYVGNCPSLVTRYTEVPLRDGKLVFSELSSVEDEDVNWGVEDISRKMIEKDRMFRKKWSGTSQILSKPKKKKGFFAWLRG